MLQSQAALAGSLRLDWPEETRKTLRTLLGNIAARDRAETYVTVRAGKPIPREIIDTEDLILIQESEALVKKSQATFIANMITETGDGPVEIHQSDFIYAESNTFFDGFLQKVVSSA